MTARSPRTRARTLAAVASLALTAALTACAPPPAPSSADQVRNTITRYDRILAEGYRSMDMSRIRQVAEELQSEDEYVHMSALGEGGVRLLPLLRDRRFLKVSVEATSARVETRERWDYTHEDIKTHKTVLVQKGLVYELAWDLARHADGHWYVTDVRSVSATSATPARRFGTPVGGSGGR